jgi:sulfite reductase (NADPH) flavoprotein alpha-component
MHVVIPENAPFDPTQRAWLNGFMAGLLGMEQAQSAQAAVAGAAPESAASSTVPAAASIPDEDFPWHDPTLSLEERRKLASEKPPQQQIMAALGQLDCGQCGYMCNTYAEVISSGADPDTGKCVPGGRATAKAVKILLAKFKADGSLGTAPVSPAAAPPQNTTAVRGYHRDLPVQATLIESRRLNQPCAEKATQHVAFKFVEPVAYAPGDSLGIWPMNNPEEVELIIAILKGRGSDPVHLDAGEPVSAREALMWRRDLRAPTEELFRLLSDHARDYADRTLLAKLADDDTRAPDFGVHDVLDCLMEFRSSRPPLRDFVRALGSAQPRMYSIASSPNAYPGEVHLTVGLVEYQFIEHTYRGLGSNYLGEQLQTGRRARVFVQKAHGFALPADAETPIVMIGPGTGIAPFRAFLQERALTQAKGKNWLFFGNRKFDEDFFYREELEAWVAARTLTRLSTAFSRDQADKIYVQHRMLEDAAELWRWLQSGAHVYVCGDAKRMASDVDLALQQIAQQEGGHSVEQARVYLAELAKAGRYQRDVY